MANDYILDEMKKAQEFSDVESEYLEREYIAPIIKIKRDVDNQATLARMQSLRDNFGEHEYD